MRVLLFSHPGTNSRDIFLDVEAGFRQGGHEVIRLELEPQYIIKQRANSQQGQQVLAADLGELVRRLIEDNDIDFSIAMWANALVHFGLTPKSPGAEAMSLFERIKQPHALFWLDAPHWASNGGYAPLFGNPIVREKHLLHIINNPGTAREMNEMLGFGNVFPRRYGVNPEIFRLNPDIEPTHDIVFNLGPGDQAPTKLMLDELESDEPNVDAIRRENLDKSIRKSSRVLASATGLSHFAALEELTKRWAQSQFDAPHRPILDRLDGIVRDQPDLLDGLNELRSLPSLFVQLSDSIRSMERFHRAFTITYLSNHFDCAVFGQDSLDDWPHKLKRYGQVDYRDLSKMYARGRIGLNTMRWQDDVGLNIKPLEITASGLACVCQCRGGLGDMFEIGSEIAVFDSPSEARCVADDLLQSPEKRQAMAMAGHARTLRDHTWANWADDVCKQIETTRHSIRYTD